MANGKEQLDWPLETLLTVMRNALREGRETWQRTKGRRAEKIWKERQNGGVAQPLIEFEPELFEQVPLYPFTKGIDLTNDGLGYGEQTDLTLQLETGQTELKASRRTRTGTRCLHLGKHDFAQQRRVPKASGIRRHKLDEEPDIYIDFEDSQKVS